MIQYFLKIVTLVSLIVAGVWFWKQRDYEPALAVLAGLASSTVLFVNDERRKRKTSRQLANEEEACMDAFERIQRERDNFVKMVEDPEWRPASDDPDGEYSFAPAYIYPWELLETAVTEVKKTGRFPVSTRRILRAIEKRQPSRVLKLTDKLSPKLEREF